MDRNTTRLVDRLAPHEPSYKSRGEAQIGRLLDRYGLPFFYEQQTMVLDRGRYRIWRPDFTLPYLNGQVLEYAGMPDVPAYMAGIRHKQRTYALNEIPALFVFPGDLQGPGWPDTIIGRIYDTHVASSPSRMLRGAEDD